MLITRAWVQSREHITEVVMKMHDKANALTQKKLEAIQRLQQGLVLEPIIREREYEND
ncbi:hypothetical protein D3C84_1160460 [compost metagenome]